MPGLSDIAVAENTRRRLGLSLDAFSVHLGYSATAYRNAIRRGVISRWMMREIRLVRNTKKAPGPRGR